MTDKLFSIESLLKMTISKWILLVCFIMLLINSIAQTPGEWTWVNGDSSMNYVGNFGTMGVPSPTNKPPGIYEGAEWTDHFGNFWIYGGDGNCWCNNLWKYNVITNMWTWIQGSGNVSYQQPAYGQQGIANSTNSPGSRVTSETWTDNSGNLWLFGGYIYSAALGGGVASNDLWKYDISTNMWTWMKGDPIANGTASYGIKGVESSSNKPPACYESNLTWTDSQNNLWLLDVKGCLWKYKISTNNWIWMKGDTIGTPTFGNKGVPNINNTPGNSLFAFTRWMDSNDNLWLMYSGANIHYTTLFKYEINTNMWTWIWGDTTINNSIPDYGNALCDYDKILTPYMRGEARACWIDNCDNLWLMGGVGCAQVAPYCGDLNDLIYFDTQAFKWIRAGNDTTYYSTSIYGTIGISSPTNKPAARSGALPFKDINGDLWVYGGLNLNTSQVFGDLWRYTMDAGCPPCINPYASITENETHKDELTIYPNPFNDQMTIQLNHFLDNATLFVFDSYGQKIKQVNNIYGHNYTFKRDNFSQGLYFLQLIENNVTYTSKILITDD